MSLVQVFRDELLSRHHLALNALDLQVPEIDAAEALATRLREAGIDAKACGSVGDDNRAEIRVLAKAAAPVITETLNAMAVDCDHIGQYAVDKHNNPAIDIYRVIAAGHEVILVTQS